MSPSQSHDTKEGSFGRVVSVFHGRAVIAAICIVAGLVMFSADAAQRDLSRDALWEVVRNICVPGQTQHQDPKPCLQVQLNGGIESGFAILRDPRGGTQFLLVPTARISGIESPIVHGPHATNYFASAWEVRTYINEALHQALPRDDIGLAINSAVSRSQDQLHIHFSCIRADVLDALRKNEGKIGSHWAPLNANFFGHQYMAMWLAGEHLSPNNPFSILEKTLSVPTPDMGNRTIVVIGFTRAEGTKGFVILANRVNEQNGDLANGEELLDHACHVAAMGRTTNVDWKNSGTE